MREKDYSTLKSFMEWRGVAYGKNPFNALEILKEELKEEFPEVIYHFYSIERIK